MELFTDKIRTNTKYAVPGEPTYSFLNRSALPEFVPVREKLNAWFAHYPEDEQYELKKRLQTQRQFDDAFFELYVHEFFYRRGFHLSVHPELTTTAKQPDFIVSKEDESKFYLEVKVVHDESDHERNYKEKQNKIAHELNKLGNFPYWISIRELVVKNDSSFSVKALIRKIEEALNSFNYLRMIELASNEYLSYEDENIQIKLAFWPRTSSRIHGMNRAVGVHGYFEVGYVKTSDSLTKAIKEKAKKYGTLNHPFVLALSCISPDFLGPDDLETIIGKDCKYIRSNLPLGELNRPFFHDGIFSKTFMSKVAALLITWVTPYHPNNEQWYWCENPNFDDKEFQKSLINQIFKSEKICANLW